MLQIKCDHCGQLLKGKDVKIDAFYDYLNGVKYKKYTTACKKCGGFVYWERYAQKNEENAATALEKFADKKGETIKQIAQSKQYNEIMKKVGERAREIAATCPSNPAVKVQDIYAAVDELPQSEKDIILAHEDKQDMALLHDGNKRSADHIKPNSILLLTQAIIELAIAENDEDFFKSEYGEQIVDTYNTALTIHKSHDYGITAELLLEKMRKNAIKVKGENDDDC